ncbi:MAG TPA: RNA methyltransferase [Candidatus Eisenbergiella merdavium]|uniref:RNA methyltransferase n=1 Tax=Candidatus Eisenbergiella merdavium TaxID=2838551 RepID=A0A9D2NG23_9FIRM|nr:RNA methyltransferase [Candidatus Eisenbergiella merdavium]
MITSLSNSRIKNVTALNRKAKERRSQGKYVVEGVKMFLEAPAAEIEEVYVAGGFLERLMDGQGENGAAASCAGRLAGLPYETVSDEVFAKISDTETPQGILCVMKRKEYPESDILSRTDPLILVLEDIQDPGNLGTILRTGEGAGISGVLLSAGCADIYNPKTIRSTMGSIYRVPFAYTDSIPETVRRMKAAGIRLYAAHLKGTRGYTEPDYTQGSAFLIGNEGNGLREETAALADCYIRIPMKGQVESLNAAMAAGILMYETARQRSGKESLSL